MISNKFKIKVANGIEHISDWQNEQGYVIDQLVGPGRSIINKWVTGCGFTTLYLSNPENVILVSPRVGLIQNKVEQFNDKTPDYCFYFNREIDSTTDVQLSIDELTNKLFVYVNYAIKNHRPFKILVTYDSFATLTNIMEQDLHIDISKEFRVVVDESHCLIKDVFLKEYNNRCVLSTFLNQLFRYNNILFISATPIQDYVQEIPEFQQYPVDYYELEWPNISPVTRRLSKCKSSLDAFKQIYQHYTSQYDQNGKHVFDEIYYGNNNAEFSYEAVIFLNNVADICHILGKFITNLHLIEPKDVTVICAKTKENKRDLRKLGLQPCQSIPKQSERHTRWTFCTRCAFEGVDFYSTNASTYVVANYNIASLALDVASDIHQIIGRQRLECNHFRNIIHIFHRDNSAIASDQEFQAFQQQKFNESMKRIEIWNTTSQDLKSTLLDDLTTIIEVKPEKLYVRTVNGYPEINQLLITSEKYCQDVLKNHQTLFILMKQPQGTYLDPIQELKIKLDNVSCATTNQERIRIAHEFYAHNQELHDEFFEMLCKEGYTTIAKYFTLLVPERIAALGHNSTRLNEEIDNQRLCNDVVGALRELFVFGSWYSMREVKIIMQQAFNKVGMHKIAKASDLPNYIKCTIKRYKEERGFVIL